MIRLFIFIVCITLKSTAFASFIRNGNEKYHAADYNVPGTAINLATGLFGSDSQDNYSSGIVGSEFIEAEYKEEEDIMGISYDYPRNLSFDKFCLVTLNGCLLLSETYDHLQDEDVKQKEKESRISAYLENILSVTTDKTTYKNKNKNIIASVEQKINSLNHPFCYEAFKRVGSHLTKSQISWLIKKAPEVILENGECLKSLKDFSFINAKMLRRIIPDHFASRLVDLLQISKFWETASTCVLMQVIVREYNPVVHEVILRSNVEKIKCVSDLLTNPLYYPFVSRIPGEILEKPSDYEANPKFIIDYIRNEKYGLDKRILLSIVSYVQLTNRIIANSINDIAQKWVHLHVAKEFIFPTPMNVRNEVFNKQTQKTYSNLRYLICAREEVNDLLSDLENGTIQIKMGNAVERSVFVESLNVICQTAFDLVTRKSFEMRKKIVIYVGKEYDDHNLFSYDREIQIIRIHPKNHVDGINLPTPRQEISSEQSSIDPHLRFALWCGFTFNNGKSCYKDKYSGIPVHAIITNWEYLYDIIGGSFTSDQLTLNLLNDVSYPDFTYTDQYDVDSFNLKKEIRRKDAEPVLSLLLKLGSENLNDTGNLINMWIDNQEIWHILSVANLNLRFGADGFKTKTLTVRQIEFLFRDHFIEYVELSKKCFLDEALRPVYSFCNQKIVDEFHSNCSRLFILMRQISTIFMLLGDNFSIDQLYANNLTMLVVCSNGNGEGRFYTPAQLKKIKNTVAVRESLDFDFVKTNNRKSVKFSENDLMNESTCIIELDADSKDEDEDHELEKVVLDSKDDETTVLASCDILDENIVKLKIEKEDIANELTDTVVVLIAKEDHINVASVEDRISIANESSVSNEELKNGKQYIKPPTFETALENGGDVCVKEKKAKLRKKKGTKGKKNITDEEPLNGVSFEPDNTIHEIDVEMKERSNPEINMVADCDIKDDVDVDHEHVQTAACDNLDLDDVKQVVFRDDSLVFAATSTNLNVVDLNDPLVAAEWLNNINSIEAGLLKKFSSISEFVESKLRSSVNNLIDSSNFCPQTLKLCAYFLEINSSPRTEESYPLEHVLVTNITKLRNIPLTVKTLNHPMCFDTFKRIGIVFTSDHINWFVNNAPFVIFDNIELLTSLKDFSFYTLKVYYKIANKFLASTLIDLLKLEAFWRTAPLEFLLFTIKNRSNGDGNATWEMFAKYRPLENLISDPVILEDPRYYSFFSGLVNTNPLIGIGVYPEIDEKYLIGSGERIVNAVRIGGLSQPLMESIFVYILNTNRMISWHLNFIAYNWTDLHKNLHVEIQDGSSVNSEYTKERNLSFDETVSGSVSTLRFIKEERERLNVLLDELEKEKGDKHFTNMISQLKTLAQTPFDFSMRKIFNERVDFASETLINLEDEKNIVPLPRIYNSQCEETRDTPDINIVMHPILRTSLWRNVFFDYNPVWKHEMYALLSLSPEDQSEDAKIAHQKYLKPKFETIFRDIKKLSVHLLDCWMTLGAQVLSNSGANGKIFISFLLDISIMPKGNELGNKIKVERLLLGKKMIEALKLIDPVHFDDILVAHLKSLWSDNPMIIDELEIKGRRHREQHLKIKNNNNNTNSASPLLQITPIPKLESYCEIYANNIASISTKDLVERPDLVVEYYNQLRMFETHFRTLGDKLSEEQILEISTQNFIMKMLKLHGRAISITQVAGLLESEVGKSFLQNNREISTALIDYSAFNTQTLREVGINLDEIKLNAWTLKFEVKLAEIAHLRSFEDPVGTTFELGSSFWTRISSQINLLVWPFVNPISIALCRQISGEELVYSVTLDETKLSTLNESHFDFFIEYLIKWSIEQEWNGLIYLASLEIISKIQNDDKKRSLETDTMNASYEKYLIEQMKGKQEVLKWIKGKDQLNEDFFSLINLLFKSDDDDEDSMLQNSDSVKIDSVKSLLMKYSNNNTAQYIAKVDAISFFKSLNPESKNSVRSDFKPSEIIKKIFMTLSRWDSTILCVLLKKHGFNIETILNSTPSDSSTSDQKRKPKTKRKP